MLSVDEALAAILAEAASPSVERALIEAALGRVAATDILATMDQPPFRAAAMDGYAVRFADATIGARLTLIGEAPAGAPFDRAVGAGEAVRIFTGGAVPAGADHVLIQEEAEADGDEVAITAKQSAPSHVRAAGVDFRAQSILKRKGERLTPIDLGLIASANIASVDVFARPVVAYVDNGDELREPGAALRHGEIVGSNRFAMDALIAAWGGAPQYLGRALDDPDSIREKFDAAKGADIFVTIGGASVGEHDHVRAAFAAVGGALIFSKIAVRPGKPTWFGRLGGVRVLGLPGNPASAIVCALLFLRPLIAASGGEIAPTRYARASLSESLAANGPRESYLRGAISVDPSGLLRVAPFANQDSSLYSPLVHGNCLIRRMPQAPSAPIGALVDCLVYRSPFGRSAA